MNREKLKSLIDESGMTVTSISDKLGISRKSLYLKLDGKTEFKVSEMAALSKILHMSSKDRNSIFFS